MNSPKPWLDGETEMSAGERKKPCCTCHKPKPLSDFARCSKAPDGRQYQCKACHKNYVRGLA